MSVRFSEFSEYTLLDRPGMTPRKTPTNFYGNSRESTNTRKRPAYFKGRMRNSTSLKKPRKRTHTKKRLPVRYDGNDTF
jgi:hypothetical protein|uniref:Uncharacterized protein n=1 Tax=viral metagenome TaxID=1070528 RepID=A0A6C0DXE0_9ZZZZ